MAQLPVKPSKIIGVGRNYRAHAAEMGNPIPTEPLLFFKPPSALIGDGQAIIRPRWVERMDYEGELAIVIGRRCRRVARGDALDVIGGYTILNDVTARELQKKDGQFTRAKGFDTFCPVGPRVVAGLDPAALAIETRVNGAVRQKAPTADMIFDVSTIVEYVTRVMTLEEGDVISTGSPPGVGPLVAGDVVEIEIAGIGVLRNPVVDEENI